MPANYPVKGLLFLYIPMVCGYLPRKPRLHFNLKLQLYTYRAVDIRLSLQRYSPSLVEFGQSSGWYIFGSAGLGQLDHLVQIVLDSSHLFPVHAHSCAPRSIFGFICPSIIFFPVDILALGYCLSLLAFRFFGLCLFGLSDRAIHQLTFCDCFFGCLLLSLLLQSHDCPQFFEAMIWQWRRQAINGFHLVSIFWTWSFFSVTSSRIWWSRTSICFIFAWQTGFLKEVYCAL